MSSVIAMYLFSFDNKQLIKSDSELLMIHFPQKEIAIGMDDHTNILTVIPADIPKAVALMFRS